MAAEEIVDAFISSRKNSNRILDLEVLLLSENVKETKSAIAAVVRLFTYILKNGYMRVSGNTTDPGNAEEKYRCWLLERYSDVISQLLEHFSHNSKNVQKASFFALMEILKVEGEHPLRNISENAYYFPNELFRKIMSNVLSEEKDMRVVITYFQEFATCDDISFYILESVLFVLNKLTSLPTEILLHNVFALLSQVHITKRFETKNTAESVNVFIPVVDGHAEFVVKEKTVKKVFSSVWLKFLSFKLPAKLYKSVLIVLHQEILPNLNNPLLLTDFLTNSYNAGGAAGLLALDGLFFLMQNCNLEYPHFFRKLYALVNSSTLESQYRARFFFKADLFLSSTHLPAYLVASFVKRLCRLTFEVSSPNVIVMILVFIENLLIRHPSLKVLLHRTDKEGYVDPYLFDETDPAKSNALESSLWEIKSLQTHYHPKVSKKAKFINNALPKIEIDLGSVLEITIPDIIAKETRSKTINVAQSFYKPSGLLDHEGSVMNELWSL